MQEFEQRIDYLRVGRPELEGVDVTPWKLGMETFFVNHILPDGDSFGKWASWQNYFDSEAHTWITCLEVWGKAADDFFHHYLTPDYGTILRVDLRFEVQDIPCSLGQLEAYARKRNTNGFRTITRIDSRSRSKKGGRDPGGMFFAVGSRESQRRTSVYKRGNEPWAIEVQFGRNLPQRARQEAVQAYMDTSGKYDSWRDAFIAVLYQKAEDAVRDQLGLELEFLMGWELHDNPLEGFEYQESLFSDLLGAMPEFATEQVRKVVDLGVAELGRRGKIVNEDPIEPAWLWDNPEAEGY